MKRLKLLEKISENALLVKADVVDLYPRIPHKAGLSAHKEALISISCLNLLISCLILKRKKLKLFMEDINNLMPNHKFICDPGKKNLFLGPLRHFFQR